MLNYATQFCFGLLILKIVFFIYLLPNLTKVVTGPVTMSELLSVLSLCLWAAALLQVSLYLSLSLWPTGLFCIIHFV